MESNQDFRTQFQTPPEVAKYMAHLASVHLLYTPDAVVLEPTEGIGNISRALQEKGLEVYAPGNYFDLDPDRKFDAVVMNPPFSGKSLFGAPEEWHSKGMRVGYKMLKECMGKTDVIIALMPWFTLVDSDVRMRELKRFGLRSVTALPRKTFDYARIQTVVMEFKKGWERPTEFKVFDLMHKEYYLEEL